MQSQSTSDCESSCEEVWEVTEWQPGQLSPILVSSDMETEEETPPPSPLSQAAAAVVDVAALEEPPLPQPQEAGPARSLTSRSTRWCFTSFEEVPPEPATEGPGKWMEYLIVGKEVAPGTGREHWQGYLETCRRITMSELKRKPGFERAHLEPARGTAEQSVVYCSKDGNWIEWGEVKNTGERGRPDLTLACQQVLDGSLTVREVVMENPHLHAQYGRTLLAAERIRQDAETRGDFCPQTVHWYWGESGAGKSKRAWADARAEAAKSDQQPYSWLTHDKDWQDNYDGQKVIILDDFRGNIPFSLLLRFLDGYPMAVSRRNIGPRNLLSTHWFITSSVHPKDVYSSEKFAESLWQLMRRISLIVKFEQTPLGVAEINETPQKENYTH